MKQIEKLKDLVFNGLLTKDSLHKLENQGINVEPNRKEQIFAQIEESSFSPRIVYDARRMAAVYTAFFCLENSVRELIVDRLTERKGSGWWERCVPGKIKSASQKLKEKEEKNRYHAQRSQELIGYTMFGNLAQIIIANWDNFSDLFPEQSWLSSRFNDLDISRNIIMHTGQLPEIEIERIESIARDWIRQVG